MRSTYRQIMALTQETTVRSGPGLGAVQICFALFHQQQLDGALVTCIMPPCSPPTTITTLASLIYLT